MIAPLLLALAASAAPVPPAQDTTGGAATYTINATLDERAHVVRARERIEFRNRAGAGVGRLYLHLFPNAFRDARTAFAREYERLPWSANPLDLIPWGSRRGFMTIQSVIVGHQPAAFTVAETVLEVALSSPLAPGELLSMEIAFEIKLPVLQVLLGYRGGSYALGLWYPKLAVPDTAGWPGEGKPAERDFYADLSSYDVRITAASRIVVAAGGELQGQTDSPDGTTTRRWIAEHARDFAWVADPRYRAARIGVNDVTVEYLHAGRDDASLDSGVAAIRAALEFYGTRYGPYGHRTLVIAELPALGSGIGGVAFSQLIMIPSGMRRSSLSRPLYEGVLTHEVAHQWWGLAVGTRDPVDDWLSEGFAEFSSWEVERYRQASGRGEPRRMATLRLRRAEYANQASLGFDRRILQGDSAFGDPAVREVALYAKAPLVLAMLQGVVGGDTLNRILRAYAERYRYRLARTADFIALADSVSGQDLGTFFTRWLSGTTTLPEIDQFNNRHSRRVRSSFRPRIADDGSYSILHLPFVLYDKGVEPGLLLVGGGALQVAPPSVAQPAHFAVLTARYNLATHTPGVAFVYANRLGWPVSRAFWGLRASRDGRHETAAVNAQAIFGPHLYRAPFHSVEVSLTHEREFAAGSTFERGRVGTLQLSYSLRALATDFYPIHGAALAVATEGAMPGLDSDWGFLRVAGQAEFYRRVFGGTKLALNLFGGTTAAGAPPRQKLFFLGREGNLRAGGLEVAASRHLSALNAELRVPLGTGTLAGVAVFGGVASYWGAPSPAGGIQGEAGLGLRLFDNSAFGVQLDLPFWSPGPTGGRALDFTRLSLRFGRPFRGPAS